MVGIKRRDPVAGSDSAFFVAVQQQSCSSQEIQPSTWRRISSLHLAETLKPTELLHGNALHLYTTCKLLLCVRLGMSRDRRCGHHAVETPLHACTAVRVTKYQLSPESKGIFHLILIPKLFKFPDKLIGRKACLRLILHLTGDSFHRRLNLRSFRVTSVSLLERPVMDAVRRLEAVWCDGYRSAYSRARICCGGLPYASKISLHVLRQKFNFSPFPPEPSSFSSLP